MTPETKKTLLWGGAITLGVGILLYFFQRYENSKDTANAVDPTTGQPAADAAAQAAQAQALADEETLAAVSSFSSGESLSAPSLSAEAPSDNFSHEIASILQSVGIGTPAPATGGTGAPSTGGGSTGSTQTPTTGGTTPVPTPTPVGGPVPPKSPSTSPARQVRGGLPYNRVITNRVN